MVRLGCSSVALVGVVFSLVLVAVSAGAQTASPKSVYVSPTGDDHGDGTQQHAFRTLQRARDAVRLLNLDSDVTVYLEDGTYTLDGPLRLTAADGGHGNHHVTWTASPGAHPVLSGGIRVTDWRPFDPAKHIFVADVPKGTDARQLFVNGVLADRAAVELDPADIELTANGVMLRDPSLGWLKDVREPGRLELEVQGSFTDRYAPVASLQSEKNVIVLTMAQPSWANNTWGYDVPNGGGKLSKHFFLVNGLELMGRRREWHRNQDQWYIDPAAGKLYFKPDQDEGMESLSVVLPRLPALLSVSGTYDTPVQNLTISGLRFANTTWMGPSAPTGYASQQSGAYLKDPAPVHPPDAFQTCSRGCPAFEAMRQHWSQIPAAVQVSAARHITFQDDTFSQIGQVALGIGNDADANLSGVGLGTDGVQVLRCHFAVIAGGAILAGGVQRDAHHPSDARMTNRNLTLSNNFISSASLDYKDNAGILSTYFDGATIIHNDVSDLTYDGIDIGWGWGYNDQGGNPNYRDNQHGYTVNPIFQTPTTLRNNLVAANRIHGVKKLFIDGGAIYNLSASPGTVIQGNYIFDIGQRIGLYVDEGSKHIRLEHNVVETQGFWLFANTVGKLYALRITSDNRAAGNWHNSDKVGQRWIPASDNLIVDDHLVADKAWPEAAQQVIGAAGIQH